MIKLYQIPEEFKALEAMLMEMDENELMLNMETVQELMNSLNDQLERKLDATGRVVKNLEGEFEAIKKERERLQKREKALDNQIGSLKSYVLATLEANNLQSIKGETLKIRWQNNSAPSVKVQDMKVVPIEYLREVTKAEAGVFKIGDDYFRLKGDSIMKIDSKAVGDYFKQNNETVPGCEVNLGKHVRIS